MSPSRHKLSQEEINNLKSICIFCWGRLGDVFIRTPIIDALRKKLPGAEITIVTDPAAARAFNPYTTTFNVFPFKRASKGNIDELSQNMRNIKRLRREKFDISIDLYGGGSSAAISYLVASRIRLAFDHTLKLRLLNNLIASDPQDTLHWSQSYGSILAPLGIDHKLISSDVIYNCDEKSRSHIRPLFNKSDTRYIGINLGASTLDKAWPIKNTIELLTALRDHQNITPVIFFNPGQEYLSEQFLSSYPHQCVSLKGLNFEQEAAALEQCDIFTTGDTALMHLATGVKTPVFAFFLQTRPENVQPRLNPFHACLIEDYNKELIHGLHQLKDEIPVSTVLSEFINFTKSKLNWTYE